MPADFGNEIGNATRRREIVNQGRHLRALRLDNFARLRERHRVASVQKQFHIFASELSRNGAADPAAGACDQISFHALVRNVERPALNVQCRIKMVGRDRRARRGNEERTASRDRGILTIALRPPQRKPVVRRFPQAQSNQLLIHTIINLWPKRAHDVFACRRRAAKILSFQIQMAILPGFQ